VTDQLPFFQELVRRLSAMKIEFMVVGSLASSALGEVRATQDADLVILLPPDRIDELVRQFSGRYYISREAVIEAVNRRSMFNVIDIDLGWKADLILLKNDLYHQESFRRRMKGSVLGMEVPTLTPEDSILSKLDWTRESLSERQLRDAIGVARLWWDRLDRPYLFKWAEHLQIAPLLHRVLAEAEKLQDY
jgi:hypothetical protein